MTKTYEQGKPELVTELTPQLAENIWKGLERKRYNDKVSKEAALHNLKQVKAEMGKRAKNAPTQFYRDGVLDCMQIITNKIAKINGK